MTGLSLVMVYPIACRRTKIQRLDPNEYARSRALFAVDLVVVQILQRYSLRWSNRICLGSNLPKIVVDRTAARRREMQQVCLSLAIYPGPNPTVGHCAFAANRSCCERWRWTLHRFARQKTGLCAGPDPTEPATFLSFCRVAMLEYDLLWSLQIISFPPDCPKTIDLASNFAPCETLAAAR